jgi:two-component system, OmpR family, sensor kinase
MSLRLRLVLALAPLFVIGLVVADVVTYTTLRGSLVSQLDTELQQIEGSVQQDLQQANRFPGGGGDEGGGNQPLPPGAYGEILTASGQPAGGAVVEPMPGQTRVSAHPVLPAINATDVHQSFDAPGTGGVGTYRVYVDDTAPPLVGGLLVTALPEDNVNATLGEVLLIEGLATAGLTLLVGLATWMIVRRGLQPLERMAATARSIAASDLSKRVEPSTEETEVGRLGIAINGMLAQLEAAFNERARNEARLRHFISDASHELRTPLTSMQGYAELLQRESEMDPQDVELATRRIEE